MRLSHDALMDLREVAKEILGAEYVAALRVALFAGIDVPKPADLPQVGIPADQLYIDLMNLNQGAGIAGVPPLKTWMLNLVTLRGNHASIGRLRQIHDKWMVSAAAQAVRGHLVFECCDDKARHPLLDRGPLRDFLHQTVERTALNVWSVVGDPASGKTYSRRFIRLAADRFGIRLVEVDTLQDLLDAYTPRDLVAAILAPLGEDCSGMPEQGELQEARWLKDLRDWVLSKLHGVEDTWIVLDHFDDETVTTATRGLIKRLVEKILYERSYPPMVLLGYERQAQSDELNDDVEREPTGAIHRSHVEDYYRTRFAGLPPNELHQAVAIAVDEVYARLPVEHLHRDINTAIRQVNKGLEERNVTAIIGG